MKVRELRSMGVAGVLTALQAMCDGLVYQSRRKNFKIDMTTFGNYTTKGRIRVVMGQLSPEDTICFGCAATCTLQEITNIDFDFKSIFTREDRQKAVDESYRILQDFEIAMDNARRGDLRKLYAFCGAERHFNKRSRSPVTWFLNSNNWCKEIRKVKIFINKEMKINNLVWVEAD